jgi:peptidoglycan hydrolase CwlO-like protein
MNTQSIILVQSATSAMIEIILSLVGSLLIGFITAWFYQKSVFTPIVKRLEDEKESLNKKITGLNNDITVLKSKIGELENRVAEKDKEIADKIKELELLKKPVK